MFCSSSLSGIKNGNFFGNIDQRLREIFISIFNTLFTSKNLIAVCNFPLSPHFDNASIADIIF